MYLPHRGQLFVAATALAMTLAALSAIERAAASSIPEVWFDAGSRQLGRAMAANGGIARIVARSLLPMQDAHFPVIR
jgi:hypothetical protein